MEENQASLRVWISRKPFFFWDRRDANTWSRRAIRVMRQLQPWIVEPKIRMPGRGLRIISLRTLFEHWRSLPEWWVRRRSPLLNFTVTAGDETAADLLAAGTENISLAEWFHFLGRLSISLWSLQKAYFFFVLRTRVSQNVDKRRWFFQQVSVNRAYYWHTFTFMT